MFLTGGHASLPGISETLGKAAGLAPITIPRPDAAVDGALRLAASPGGLAATTAVQEASPLRSRSECQILVSPGLHTVTAIVLLKHTLSTGWVEMFEGRAAAYFLRLPQLEISGFLIALACWTAGMAVTYLRLTAARTLEEQASSTRASRRALFAAAGQASPSRQTSGCTAAPT